MPISHILLYELLGFSTYFQYTSIIHFTGSIVHVSLLSCKMGDDLQTWRSRIGSYVHPPGCKFKSTNQPCHSNSCSSVISLSVRCCFLMLLVISMTVERNPGPKTVHTTPTKKTLEHGSKSVTSPNESSPSQKVCATSKLRKRTKFSLSLFFVVPVGYTGGKNGMFQIS